jgi:hypothetical protein
MTSAELGVSGAVRMNAGYSGESATAVARSDTRFYRYAKLKHQPLQVAYSERISCENGFGTSSRNSLLTSRSFTCPSFAFLAGVICMSADSTRYFCVICCLLAL